MNIDVSSKNKYYKSKGGVLFSSDMKNLIKYPEGKKENGYVIPESVTSICDSAFWRCSSLTSLTIPESVTSIGDHAFRECSSLTSLTIPESVTSIGNFAFCSCSNLTSLTIPESVTSIGNFAFWECISLTNIYIPVGSLNRLKSVLPSELHKFLKESF